jgi:hypothetical protein
MNIRRRIDWVLPAVAAGDVGKDWSDVTGAAKANMIPSRFKTASGKPKLHVDRAAAVALFGSEEWIRLADAAERVGVGRGAIARAIRGGSVRMVELGWQQSAAGSYRLMQHVPVSDIMREFSVSEQPKPESRGPEESAQCTGGEALAESIKRAMLEDHEGPKQIAIGIVGAFCHLQEMYFAERDRAAQLQANLDAIRKAISAEVPEC